MVNKKNTYKQELGTIGENLICLEYAARGCKILARNMRLGRYELDIIAYSPENEYIFIEVKTRSTTAFGGMESVTAHKLKNIQYAALAWMAKNHLLGVPFRIDVAECILPKNPFTNPHITIIEGIGT